MLRILGNLFPLRMLGTVKDYATCYEENYGADFNAEGDDLYYCSKCDEGFSSINPTDEGQFCDSCLPSSATLHDEMERITMNAETFSAESNLDHRSANLRELRKLLERELSRLAEDNYKIEEQLKKLERGTPKEYPIEIIRDLLSNMQESLGTINGYGMNYLRASQ